MIQLREVLRRKNGVLLLQKHPLKSGDALCLFDPASKQWESGFVKFNRGALFLYCTSSPLAFKLEAGQSVLPVHRPDSYSFRRKDLCDNPEQVPTNGFLIDVQIIDMTQRLPKIENVALYWLKKKLYCMADETGDPAPIHEKHILLLDNAEEWVPGEMAIDLAKSIDIQQRAG